MAHQVLAHNKKETEDKSQTQSPHGLMKRRGQKMRKNTWQVKNLHGLMIIVIIVTATILIDFLFY